MACSSLRCTRFWPETRMQFVRKNLGAQALMAAVVLIGLYFGYSFAREVVQAERLTRQAESSAAINARMAEENDKLARDLQYYQSDEYATLRARTDLNLRKPDELVILPVMPPDEQGPAVAQAETITTATVLTATVAAAPAATQDSTATTANSGERN